MAFQYSSLLLCMMLDEDEDEEVQLAAINGLTDITIVYGDMQAKANQDEELGVSVKEIVKGLNLYVFHAVERLQCAACEALCRLFLFDKIRSIPDLSNLFLLYYSSNDLTVDCLTQLRRNDSYFVRSCQCSSPRIAVLRLIRTADCLKKR